MAGRIIQIDISRPDAKTVSAVSVILKSGGTVVYPSDTVYGITADASSTAAVKKVAEVKGYTEVRPFIVLVRDVNRALELTPKKSVEDFMKQYWPGAVTLVVPASDLVHHWLKSDSGTVALRIPSDVLSRELLKHTGLDLISTSANVKGNPFALAVDAVSPELLKSVSMVLDGGKLPGRRPSRIIDLTGEFPVDVRG